MECSSSLNTYITASYTKSDGDLSIETFMAVSATPIQIRFRETDSSVVPIPTDSLKLPPPKTETELSQAAKYGIGFGVSFGTLAVLFCVMPYIIRARKRRRETKQQQDQMLLGMVSSGSGQADESEPPPPYSKN